MANETDKFREAEIEARAQALSKNVRCLECGHQSIEESGANIAVTLRKVIRDELREGRTEAEVYQMLSDKYGESILYAPKFDLQSAALYMAPLVALGGAAAFSWYRNRRPPPNASAMADTLFAGLPLTQREKEALLKLVGQPLTKTQ